MMASYRLIIGILLLFPFVAHAQLNIKIGYGLGYTSGNGYNDLVDEFNTQNDFRIEQKLKALHLLHGVELGIRHQVDSYGFEFSWESLGGDGLAVGENTDPALPSLFERQLFYSISTLAIGVERYFGNKGIGLSGGLRKTSFKGSISGSDVKKTFVADNQYVLKAYWMLNFRGGDIIGLSLRPYVSIPLNRFDFEQDGTYPVHDYLEISHNETTQSARLPIVGISILFYNGWQN